MTGTRSGARIVVDVLRDEGVRRVFGNPGSTELQLIDAITASGDIDYVLALHEQCVIAMADGYAQATGRPAFVNLHTMSGLGNAIGALTNARANGAPLVVTAGQQHQRMLHADPLLADDLVAIARPVSKWAHEVRAVEELEVYLRRAFLDAMTPPRGPVFLSLPWSLMVEECSGAPLTRSRMDRAAVAGGLDEFADALTQPAPGEVALVLGPEIVHGAAVSQAVALAEAMAAPVFGGPIGPVGVYPPAHACWRGVLPSTAAATRARLAGFRRVFHIGGQPFQASSLSEGEPLPEGVELLHLSPDPYQIGRTCPVALGASGDLRASLDALVPLVRARVDAGAVAQALAAAAVTRQAQMAQADARARDAYGAVPIAAVAAVHALLDALPEDAVVVDEAVSNSHHVRALHLWHTPGRMYSGKQIIGWGMPAAVGIALAHERRLPVLCINSDGGALFSPQALWSAAHERVPVVFAILVNNEYGILKNLLAGVAAGENRPVAGASVDLDNPRVDHLALAAAFGVPAERVKHAADIGDCVRRAFAAGGPRLVEIPIATSR
ncbi:MAG: thiamine pyrophosphate-binding protein [Gammaproteobacteria bacterium]